MAKKGNKPGEIEEIEIGRRCNSRANGRKTNPYDHYDKYVGKAKSFVEKKVGEYEEEFRELASPGSDYMASIEEVRTTMQIQEVYRFTAWYLTHDHKQALLDKNRLTSLPLEERKFFGSRKRCIVSGASENPFLFGYYLLFPEEGKQDRKNISKWSWRMAYAYEHDIPFKLVYTFASGVKGSYRGTKKKYDLGLFEPTIRTRAKYPLRPRLKKEPA